MRRYTLVTCLLLISFIASAKVKLPALLGDNMVLQRESQVNLWGESEPNKKIVINCGWLDDEITIKSNSDGKWICKVKTPKAGGPYRISFDDGDKITLNNIYIGDVWLCSGQSNMEMIMSGKVGQPINGALNAILDAPSVENIHFFTVDYLASEQIEDDCNGEWKLPTCASVADVSALAYYFAQQITRSTGIPIGIIVNAKGGSSILSWLSEESLDNTIDKESIKTIIGDEHRIYRHPNVLHNGMVAPLTNCTFKGVLWYQGETNIDFPTYYTDLMCELVRSWRGLWEPKDYSLPFYFVQIAPYKYDDPEAIVRPLFVEAQMKAESKIDDCYMATTTDIGDDVYIHPSQKDILAKRLAALALKYSYNMQSIDADYPRFDKVEYKDGKAYVYLDSPMGVYPSTIEGFEIAGKDRVFHKAIAEVRYKKSIVKVYSPNVEKPVAIRYAFKNLIEANMVNTLGIPAPSFRSDNW